ncbi:MAG: hypothetical protein V3V09_03890 [Arenicellales bacterium]
MTKQEKIQKLIDMQKKFQAYEHKAGLDPQDYYTPQSGHELDGYSEEYQALALDVMNTAHEEIGSKR